MIEKLEIHGKMFEASNLRSLFEKIQLEKDWSPIVCFLLQLSYRPTTVNYEAPIVAKKEIEAEIFEPFEGDHWEQPQYSSASSDSEWEEEKLIEVKDLIQKDHKIKTETIDLKLPKQYWNETVSAELEKLNLSDPNSLNPGLQLHGLASYSIASLKHYVTELDFLREILFMFTGNSMIFVLENGTFQYNNIYSLKHLTDSALQSILNRFMNFANTFNRIKGFCHSKYQERGIQAFAGAVYDVYMDTLKNITELEVELVHGERNQLQAISMLHLEQHFKKMMKTIILIDRFISSSGVFLFQNGPFTILDFDGTRTCTLINSLYNEIANQSDPKLEALFILLFNATIEPIFMSLSEMLSDRYFQDPFNEFFVKEIANGDLVWTSEDGVLWDRVPLFLQSFAKSISLINKSFILVDNESCKTLYRKVSDGLVNITTSPTVSRNSNSWLLNDSVGKNSQKEAILESKHFHKRFNYLLSSIIQPCIQFVESKVTTYLFQDQKVQHHLNYFSRIMLCIDSYGTQLFLLEYPKIQNLPNWKLSRIFKDILGDENEFKEHFSVSSTKSDISVYFSYDAPWPCNQILTSKIQDRFNAIFQFLCQMNKSIQLLHSFRGDKSKMLNRLSLLSFLDSLSTFAMHSVVIPAIGEAKWENARNIDELFDMQLKLLNEIETKLFLNHPALSRSIWAIFKLCQSGTMDKDLMRFVADAFAIHGSELLVA